MQNTYYAVTFTKPDEFAKSGFMVVGQSGDVSFADADGNTLVLPDRCEYDITSPTSQSPSWGS